MNEKELSDFIINISNTKDKICFFCGAGISKEKPSHAPDFIQLRDSLIYSLLEKIEICGYIKRGSAKQLLNDIIEYLQENHYWLKPEIVLHWFYQIFGIKLFDFLQCLNQGFPNICHKVLAKICTKGNSCIITTNFDLYFEKTFEKLNEDYCVYTTAKNPKPHIKQFSEYFNNKKSKISILKPHGTLAIPSSIKTTLTQVSSEINEDVKNAILDSITNSHVIVLGYSGNDYDLFPLLKASANLTKSFTWLFYKQENLRKDINEFSSKVNIAFGDAAKICRSIMPDLSIDTNQIIDKSKFYKSWLNDFSPDKIAYSLALLGMHVGHKHFTKRMCFAIQKNSKDVEYLAKSHNVLGILQRKTNPQKSLNHYNKALNILSDFKKDYSRLYGDLLGNLGVIQYQLGNYQDALKYYQRSNYWASRYQHKHLYYSNLEDMAIIFRLEKKYSKAISYLKKTQNYFRKTGNLIELAHSLHNLALIHVELSHLAKAETLLKESIFLKEQETADFKTISGGYMLLAEINILKKEFLKGVNLLNIASKYLRNNMDVIINARIYYDTAYCLFKSNHLDIGKSFLRYADSLVKKIPYWTKDKTRMEWINKIIKEIQ